MPDEKSSWVEEARAALVTPEGWRERLAKLPAFRPRELIALTVIVIAVVAGAGVAFVRALPRPAAPVAPAVAPLPSASASGSPIPALFVHVAGAVRRPGVYQLAVGSRVIDALRAAGGAAANADVQALNLARPLTDGERLYVPRRGEAPPPEPGGAAGIGGSGGGTGGGKVNLNTATVAELDGLPGVGPVLAQRIVDYRTQHGPFRDVRDLLKIEGIGDKKFASLKDLVTV